MAADFLSVEGLAACKALANEFREDNLGDAWKDDVLQLKNQLYYAWLSLQRHPEDVRATFQTTSEPQQNKRPAAYDDTAQAKKKLRGKEGEKVNPKQCYRCLHCGDTKRLFFDHGIRQHLYVSGFSLV